MIMFEGKIVRWSLTLLFHRPHWWPKLPPLLILKVDFWAVELVHWITWQKSPIFHLNIRTLLCIGQDTLGYEPEMSWRLRISACMIWWLNAQAMWFRSPFLFSTLGLAVTTLFWFLPVRMSAMHPYIATILSIQNCNFKNSLCQDVD